MKTDYELNFRKGAWNILLRGDFYGLVEKVKAWCSVLQTEAPWLKLNQRNIVEHLTGE